MYFIRTEGMVEIGRRGDFKARLQRLFDHLGKQKGLLAATELNSAGYPSKFTGLIRWDNRDAAMAWSESDGWRAFLKDNPIAGLYTPTRPTEAYEPVEFRRRQGNLGCVTLVDVTVDFKVGNAEAYEQRCKELIEIHEKHGKGVAVSSLSRFLGGGGRFFIGWGHITRDDALASFAAPEFRRFMEANPISKYASTPPVIETYDVVHALVLQPVGAARQRA